MKVIYEFDTNDENFDRTELLTYQNAFKMKSCIYDITNKLRNCYKYDTRGSIPISEVYDELWDIISDNNVDLEEMGY